MDKNIQTQLLKSNLILVETCNRLSKLNKEQTKIIKELLAKAEYDTKGLESIDGERDLEALLAAAKAKGNSLKRKVQDLKGNIKDGLAKTGDFLGALKLDINKIKAAFKTTTATDMQAKTEEVNNQAHGDPVGKLESVENNKLPGGEYGPITLNGERVFITIGINGDTLTKRSFDTPNTERYQDTKTGTIPDTLKGAIQFYNGN
jgi:hypothetical protein